MNEIDDERDSFVPLVDYIKWTRNDKEKNNKESLNFTGDKSMIITPPNYFGMTGKTRPLCRLRTRLLDCNRLQ